MLSGFITKDGFIMVSEDEMREANATRLQQGKDEITTFYKCSNEEVDFELPEAAGNSVYFSYCLFEYGKNREGYWDAEKMLTQTDEVISVMELKYPGKQFVFLYDWSSGHDKKPADAVLLGKMNKWWGRKQPFNAGCAGS